MNKAITIEKIKLGFGSDIFNLLSSNFYKYKDMIFEELIVNSMDAGASRIDVIFHRNGGHIYKIEFLDNGWGISEKEIINTIYIAKSSKNKQNDKVKVVGTDESRSIRGLFGLGKISTREICDKLIIESWNDGIMRKIDFDYIMAEKKSNVSEYEIEVNKIEIKDKKSHGTKVVLENVKGVLDSELSNDSDIYESIKTSLRKNIPFDKNIEIFFDGHPLIPYDFEEEENLLYLAEDESSPYIPINKTLSTKHKVSGKMYLVNKNIRPEKNNYGTFIKVKDRVVNKGDKLEIIEFNSFSHNTAINKRIFLYLDADFLESDIMANRSGFRNQTGLFNIFKNEMTSHISKIWDKIYNDRLHLRYEKRKNWWYTKEEIKELDEKARSEEVKKKEQERKKRERERQKQEEINYNNLFSFIENLDKKELDKTFPFLINKKFETEKDKLKFLFQNHKFQNQNLEVFFRENFYLIRNGEKGNQLNEKIRFITPKIQFYLQYDKNEWAIDKINNVHDFEDHYKRFETTEEKDLGYLKIRNLPTDLRKTTYYEELIDEINLCCDFERYTAAMILSRKFFENILIDFYLNFFPERDNLAKPSKNAKVYSRFEQLIKSLGDLRAQKKIFLDDKQLIFILEHLNAFKTNADAVTHHLVNICNDETEFLMYQIKNIYNLICEMWTKQKFQETPK